MDRQTPGSREGLNEMGTSISHGKFCQLRGNWSYHMVLIKIWKVSTRTAVSNVSRQLRQLTATTDTTDANRDRDFQNLFSAQQSGIQDILDEMKKVQEGQEVSRLKIDFPEANERLRVTREGDEPPSGTLDSKMIICQQVNSNEMTYGQGVRQAFIYSKLVGNTRVHKYHGIAQRYGQLWAVMDDLRNIKNMNTIVNQALLPKDEKAGYKLLMSLRKPSLICTQ